MSSKGNEKVCIKCNKNINDNETLAESSYSSYCSRYCQKEDWKRSRESNKSNNEIHIDEPSFTVNTCLQEIMLVAKIKPRDILLNSNMVNLNETFNTYLNTSLEVNLPSHLQSANLSFVSSLNNEYFASFFVMQDSLTVKITVYRIFRFDQVDIHWEGDFPLSADDKYLAVVDTDGIGRLELKGLLTNDGETLFLHISSDYSHCLHLLIKDKGDTVTWIHQKGKGQCRDYKFSDDERYFFIICASEVNSTRTIESFPVEAYSTTSWEIVKKWSIDCDYKRIVTDVKLLTSLYFDELMYVAITSDDSKHILIQDLHNNVSVTLPIDHVYNCNFSQTLRISKDGKSLVAFPAKKRTLFYWNLTNPTYKPLQETNLLSVESEQDVVTSKKERLCQFSPNGEVITIITANDRVVNIQIMLSWNLHLIDQIDIDYANFNEYQVLSIGMSASEGLLIVGAIFPPYPSSGSIRVVVSSIPEIYDHVSKVEKYFDAVSNGIFTDDSRLFASWEVMAAYNKLSITPKYTSSPDSSSIDIDNYNKIRDSIYELVFLSNDCYDPGASLDSDAAEKVVHLLTFSYPWNENHKGHVFAVKCNHTIIIIAVRSVRRRHMHGEFTEMNMRILYTDKNIFSSGLTLEIMKCEDHYFLTITHKSELREYSGILHSTKTSIVITDLNIKCDAKYDIFSISDSRDITLPNDWLVSPNNIITSSSTFCGYIPIIPNLGKECENCSLRFGNRMRSTYSAAKLGMWLAYTHRDRTNDNILNEEFMNTVSNNCNSVFKDMDYDDEDWLFPCVFAGAMNIDLISNSNLLTDEFLKQYYKSKELVIKNTTTITYCIPAACRIQPIGVQSFLSHVALWTVDVEDRVISVRSKGKFKNLRGSGIFIKITNFIKEKLDIRTLTGVLNFIREKIKYLRKNETLMGIVNFVRWKFNTSLIYDMITLMKFQRSNNETYSNVMKCTLPLAGFCSYKNQVFILPEWNHKLDSQYNSLRQLAMLSFDQIPTLISNQEKPCHSFAESPFTCLVDEILDLKDEDLLLDFFEIVWIKKLLKWKLDNFAKRKYLEILLIPMFINLIIHLLNGVLITQNNQNGAKGAAAVQLIFVLYLGLHKLRQLVTQTKFRKSYFNYFDLTAIGLAFSMVVQLLSDKRPSLSFIAFSTAIMWLNMILQFRFYKQVGILLIIITDIIKGISWFLALSAVLLVGFTFIPFFLLRNEIPNSVNETNAFVNFGSALVETIKFLGNDFDSLKPWDNRASIQFFRVSFTIVMFVLFLNILIVLLNLQVKPITKKSQIKWLKQVAEIIVDIEKYFLTSRERNRTDWFPTWFTYTVTESERVEWEKWMKLKGKEKSDIEINDKTNCKIETLEQSINEFKSILQQLHTEQLNKSIP